MRAVTILSWKAELHEALIFFSKISDFVGFSLP
jgi:hypothetical protein